METIQDRPIEDIECPSCGGLTMYARVWSDGSYQQYCKKIGCFWGKMLPGNAVQHCSFCDRKTNHTIHRDIYGKPYSEKCAECRTEYKLPGAK